MLRPIAKPVLIALTMMLMSLSPMVGTTSGNSSAYHQVHLDDGTIINDGDILHIVTDPAVQGGYFGEANVTLDLQGLVIGDSYEFSLMIQDSTGYNVSDQYDSINATGNDHQEVYQIGLQADCDYVADIDVSHWDGQTMMHVGHTTFEIDVGDGCEDIEETYQSHIDSEHANVVMIPDRAPDPDNMIDADVMVSFSTTLDSNFREHIDMTYGNGDGSLNDTELWDSGLYYALMDNAPEGINWTLDGVVGISEGDDVNYFVDVQDVVGDMTDSAPIVQAYLFFNITGLGGMSPGDTQSLTFHDFSSEGEIYFQEIGDMLMIEDMHFDGNQSYHIPSYWDNADSMFQCDMNDMEESIEWAHVNDGIDDCVNGEDETEDYDSTIDSDGDGNLINDSDKMFTCDKHDNSGNSDQVNWNHINDGYEDCPNGQDEGYEHFPGMWNVQQGEGDLHLNLGYPSHDNDHNDGGEWWDDLDVSFELVNHQGQNGVSLHLTYIFTSYNDTGASENVREMADSDENGIVNDTEADEFVEKLNEDEDRTYYCHDSAGNEYEIDFELVNDGNEDCPDGADEPQDMNLTDDSNGDGDPTNDEDSWFDCNDADMTTVNMNQVNDGVEDCPNGDDEGSDGDNNFPFYLDGEHLGEPTEHFSGVHLNLLGAVNQTNDDDLEIHITFEFAVNNSSQQGIHKFEIIESDSDCVAVVAGESVPSDGEFTYDSNGTTIPVTKGDAVTEAGEFCPNHEDDNDDGNNGGTGNQNGTGGGNGDGTGGGNQDGGAGNSGPGNGTGNGSGAGTGNGNGDHDDNDPWSISIVSNDDWLLINVTSTDGVLHEGNEYHDDEFAPQGGLHIIAIFAAVEYNSTDCPAGEVMDADGNCVADPGPQDCPAGEVMDANGDCVADPGTQDCPAGEVMNAAGECVDDTTPNPEDCTAHEMWDDTTSSCVDDGLVHPEDCTADETHEINSDGVGECVANVVEPQVCPVGYEDLDNDSTTDCTAIDDQTTTNGTVVDTAPNCEVFYSMGTAGTPASNWNWTNMMDDWTEFEAPNNGEYTLALPIGEYHVYFGCWDEQGDNITLSVDGLDEIQEFEAEYSWVWGWDQFSITEEDVGEEHDMVVSWSSTDFGGNVTIHFKGVATIADSVAESDTGGLPGFTASLGLMAMLGAALILARRKDE